MSWFGGPFRYVLTLILAVAVPCCCCSFQVLMNAGGGCASPSHAVTASGANSSCHKQGKSSCHQKESKPGHEEGQLATTRGDDSASSADVGHTHEGGCACVKHDAKMLTTVKLAVEFSPPVLIALLPWPELSQVALSLPTGFQSQFDRPLPRTETSLLRLHCALIV